jgi:UDP-N-acetylmuramate--alanine ligase
MIKHSQPSPQTRVKHLHFVGIGGSGMSGIAEVLHNLGYQISGSDTHTSVATKRLEKIGCQLYYHHHASHISQAQAVVVSSAISDDNPEILAAHQFHIPVVPRAEMLAELMRFRFGIAIAGTHGKTTTTSIIAHILNTANLDPTYIIGGVLNSNGVNAKLGQSNYLIAEADESDASFLHLQPILSVITNIDHDHMATYDNDYQKLQQAFIKFTGNLPFYGACILCLDDAGVQEIISQIHRPIITYGFNNQAEVRAINISQTERQMHFEILSPQHKQPFPVTLNLIGKHNILNTLAAISICLELKIGIDILQRALTSFSGVSRRLDYHNTLTINQNKLTLFDDYGHHPNEMLAVFDSLRNTYPNKRLMLIFQPHRYSRTQDLFDDFVRVLSEVDALILLEIYPANEAPIVKINASTLAQCIRKRAPLNPVVVKDIEEVFDVLPNLTQNGDILLTLGAGDIHTLPTLLKNAYA